jgi:alpha,alpha-trehalose phosphorylase
MRYAVLMDLADVGGNVKDGVHIASIGGTWMAIVYGLAGMRDYGGRISFNRRSSSTNSPSPCSFAASASKSTWRRARSRTRFAKAGG